MQTSYNAVVIIGLNAILSLRSIELLIYGYVWYILQEKSNKIVGKLMFLQLYAFDVLKKMYTHNVNINKPLDFKRKNKQKIETSAD